MPRTLTERSLGVLLHPSSLPGRDLIGTLGGDAHGFVEWLATTGASIWQILPLTMNGKDDSPYFSSSAFAGNDLLIDLEGLCDGGLLAADVVSNALHDHGHSAAIRFDELAARKRPLLATAADAFIADGDHAWRAEYESFLAGADWLAETCLFFVLHERHGGAPWWEWPEAERRGDAAALAAARSDLAVEIERAMVVQFFFEHQWRAVRAKAAELGITILGDLPIYVSPDSADVWRYQDEFHLDDAGQLTVQSGVPPDYFSETGQLWGNPLYRWDVMADNGYRWWLARLRRCLELTDIVRIDHFRALAAYWEVAADAPNAIEGRWLPGPGQHFMNAARVEFPDFPFVAEDLGIVDDDVETLRDNNGLHGMRIIQFGFDGTPDNPHQPHRFPETCIAYTGTHDNQPIAAWWDSLDDDDRALVGGYYLHGAEADGGRATWSFIEAAIGSRATTAVIPMQDLLVLDGRARMNDPSVATGNWDWRMPADATSDGLARALLRLAERYGRVVEA